MEGGVMERWRPSVSLTKQEESLLKRLEKKRKLFGFLRRHRHEIFDDGFQAELEAMYRDTGAGKEPVPPAMLAMAILLQGYLGLSDWDAVETAFMDLRWPSPSERLSFQAASSVGWRPMSQMKPASSRAIAITILFLFLPRAMSLRYRAQSRSCARQAMRSTSSATPWLRALMAALLRAGKR